MRENVDLEAYVNLTRDASHQRTHITGVYWRDEKNKWTASITVEGHTTRLGCFDSEEEAAKAYDAEAMRLGRPFLNFLPEGSLNPDRYRQM